MSQFLQDAKRFILKNSQIADIAPLQLYASGIIFAPKMAIARRNFERELPDWIYRGPRVEETWSPELQTLEGHSGFVQSVAFSSDSQVLASGSGDETIKLWDPATGTLKHTLNTNGIVTSTKFSKKLPQLITNLGIFNIHPWHESLSSNCSEIKTEVSLQLDRWVTIQGQRELWIPPDYLPTSSTVKDGAVAFGCRNGKVYVMTFSI